MREHWDWEGSMEPFFPSISLFFFFFLSLEAGRGCFANKGITKAFCQPITYHPLGKSKEQPSKGPGASQVMGPIIGLKPTLLEGA